MPAEIELKFVGSPTVLGTAPRSPWLRGLARGKAKKSMLASVYFDTPDCKLRRHGLALRIRKVGRTRLQTIKQEGNGAGNVFVRDEWEKEIGADRPDFALAKDTPLPDLLSRKAADSIRPVFETVVERTRIPLHIGTSEIEVAIDRGWIRCGNRRQRIGEIELELKQGGMAELATLAARLAESLPVSFEVRSKAERGYALDSGEWGKPIRGGDIHLDSAGKAADAFRIIGFSCLHHLAANREAVCNGEPDGVHQMRIGARRLRAAISAFKEMLASPETEGIKIELKWITDQLAPARDFHVLLDEVLLPLRDKQPNEPGVELLIADVEHRRAEGFKAAKTTLRSERYRKAILRTALWLAAGEWSRSEDPLVQAWREHPIQEFGREVLSHRAEKIVKKGRKLSGLDHAHRHKLRIAVKKLRYSAEFFSSLFSGSKAKKERKRFESVLKALQNALGKLNDIAVHETLAAELASDAERAKERPQEAYAMGLVIGREQRKAAACVAAAKKAVKKLSGADPFWH
ncbi:MAG TPA: CHAD domain-containing protein [Rhizomicrobium sp.]